MSNYLKNTYSRLSKDRRFSDIFHGSIYALSSRLIASFLGLITNMIIARAYGPASFGLLAIVNSYLGLISMFTLFGAQSSINRFIPEYRVKYSLRHSFEVYRKINRFIIIGSIITGLVLASLSDLIARHGFSKAQIPTHILFFASLSVLLFSLMQFNEATLRALRHIRGFALMQAMPSIAMLVLIIPFAFILKTPEIPVYLRLASIFITTITGIFFIKAIFKEQLKIDNVSRADSPVGIGYILSVSFPLFLSRLVQYMNNQFIVIILANYVTQTEVGFFSAANSFAVITGFILQSANSIAPSKFSEYYSMGRMDDLFYIAKKTTKMVFWATAPILLALIILGKPILGLLYGRDFVVAYPALAILVAGQFVNAASGQTGIFMVMTGAERMLLLFISLSAVINIVLCLLLIPVIGIDGAAAGVATGMTVWNIACLIYIKVKYGKTILYLPFIKIS